MSAEKTIVVLGAGPAATPFIRQTMVNYVLKHDDTKIIVVTPSSDFHWPVATPRLIVPGQLDLKKVSIPLASTFDYPPTKFEFVLGKAVSLDPSSNTVGVELNDGGSREINYHTLVIATGARAKDEMPWKSLGPAEKTRAKIQAIQEQVKNAKTIVVAGGGLTGVETAGELGFEYSKEGKKEIILVHSGELPLYEGALVSVRQAAKKELEKLKVKVIPNSTVVGTTTNGNETTIELRGADGKTQTITAQAYLPTTGVIPNTEFVPKDMLDSNNYIKQTKKLQAEGHSNIFVIGDAGNLEGSQIGPTEAQVKWIIKNFPLYLGGAALPDYAPGTKTIYAVTIGRSRATGQMGGFKLFSIMVWFMKGRYLGTDYSEGWAAGKRTMMGALEK